MKRRFVIAFALLFAMFSIGIGTSIYLHWKSSTGLRRVVTGHRIEEIRHQLSSRLRKSQTDLQVSNTVFAANLDEIIANVQGLDGSIQACFGCHHEPVLHADLEGLSDLVERYKAQFGTFIAAVLDSDQRQALQLEAATTANQIDQLVNSMMLTAANGLNERTDQAISVVDRSWKVLAVTLMLTFVAAVLITSILVRGVTEPVSRLVAATERLRSGDLGHQIEHHQQHELGALMNSFNQMSGTLASNRERIDGYVGRLRTLNQAVFSLYATPDANALRERLIQTMEELVPAEAYGTVLQADVGDTFVAGLREVGQPEASHFHAISGHKLAKIRQSSNNSGLLEGTGDPPEWPFGPFDLDTSLRNYLVGWIDFEGDLRGALILVNKQGGEFVSEDSEILTALTQGVAEAIENIRLYQEARTR